MAKNAKNELPFELGQWVTTEDGYGQVMYIRPYFVENYETDRKERTNGEFIRYIFICKILCDFNGKIRIKINTYTSISKLDKEGSKFIKDIKESKADEYSKYILFDVKSDICRQVFLDYKVVSKLSLNLEEVKQKLSEIVKKLYPAFTFNEFKAECHLQKFPVDFDQLIPYGYSSKKEETVTLRLDSYLYKVTGKEAIFHDVRVFF